MGNKYSILARQYSDDAWTEVCKTEWFIIFLYNVIAKSHKYEIINYERRK